MFHRFFFKRKLNYFLKLLRTEIMNLVVPIFTKQIVSSTYCFQNVIYLTKLGKSQFSNSIIKMSAKTGPRREPMATPSLCTYVLHSKIK